jgi:hypothetical protein
MKDHEITPLLGDLHSWPTCAVCGLAVQFAVGGWVHRSTEAER